MNIMAKQNTQWVRFGERSSSIPSQTWTHRSGCGRISRCNSLQARIGDGKALAAFPAIEDKQKKEKKSKRGVNR